MGRYFTDEEFARLEKVIDSAEQQLTKIYKKVERYEKALHDIKHIINKDIKHDDVKLRAIEITIDNL